MEKRFCSIALFLFGLTYFCLTSVAEAQLTEKDTAEVRFINSRKFFNYKVSKGETLYSISQKFKIPQDEILEFNKEVATEGLKNKMKLLVPAYSWAKKDTTATAIEVKPEYLETYKIAIVTSLQLPKIFTGRDSLGMEEPFSKEVRDNLEFVEGIISSTEQHKNKPKIRLYIIDAEGDSAKMVYKLRKHMDCNLVITNESGSMLRVLSGFSQTHNLKLFSCGVNTYETIRKNGNAFALMPSSATQCERAGIFAAKYFSRSNVISLRTDSWKENERSDLFNTGWLKFSERKPKKPDYSKDPLSVGDSLIKSDLNVVFIPTSNEEIVSSVLSTLKEKAIDYRLNVVGLPTWQNFETVDQKLLDKCNVHLFSSGMIDYNSEEVTNFRKRFRDKYNTEPSDISFQGYDAFIIVNNLLQKGGANLVPDEEHTIKGIYSEYQFSRKDSNTCFENTIIHVYQPTKETYSDLARNIKFN